MPGRRSDVGASSSGKQMPRGRSRPYDVLGYTDQVRRRTARDKKNDRQKHEKAKEDLWSTHKAGLSARDTMPSRSLRAKQSSDSRLPPSTLAPARLFLLFLRRERLREERLYVDEGIRQSKEDPCASACRKARERASSPRPYPPQSIPSTAATSSRPDISMPFECREEPPFETALRDRSSAAQDRVGAVPRRRRRRLSPTQRECPLQPRAHQGKSPTREFRLTKHRRTFPHH